MASALLRTSFLRGSAFRRVVSAAAGAVAPPSGTEALLVRRAVPLPSGSSRPLFSGTPDDKFLSEKVKLLHQSIKEMNINLDKRYVIYAALKKLIEEKKPHNPFGQWSWQVAAVIIAVNVKIHLSQNN